MFVFGFLVATLVQLKNLILGFLFLGFWSRLMNMILGFLFLGFWSKLMNMILASWVYFLGFWSRSVCGGLGLQANFFFFFIGPQIGPWSGMDWAGPAERVWVWKNSAQTWPISIPNGVGIVCIRYIIHVYIYSLKWVGTHPI